MKKILLVLPFILTVFLEYSCSKNNSGDNVLVGKWSIVNDSTLNTPYILDLGDTVGYGGNYIGEPNDYFNFSSNGTLIVLSNSADNGFLSTTDSSKYNAVTNNQVEISIYFIGFSWGPANQYINPAESRTYVISNLTTHSATLTFETVHPSAMNVSGIETETINLKR